MEDIWLRLCRALDANDEALFAALATQLSESGDARGSYALGFACEVRAKRASLSARDGAGAGAIDRNGFIEAAHWYTRAISQGGGYQPHSGLASYYYYGLGGKYDFKLAYRHLKSALGAASAIQGSSEARLDIAKNQIMLAELHLLGLGAPRDLEAARTLFSAAAKTGYPAALLGMSRVERAQGHILRSLFSYLSGLYTAIKLFRQSKSHPLLAGIGGKWQTFRRDWLRKSAPELFS